jgi:hypothetical protein
MLCKVGVQAVEMRDRHRLQRDMTQRRDDLGLGVDGVLGRQRRMPFAIWEVGT